MDTKDIMELITSEYSWEQIIYKIVAWEGLDPWDLDINKLSDSFIEYISQMKNLDFKIPAKYIIIAAVLLRMKSDHLKMIPATDVEEEADVEEMMTQPIENGGFEINPISVPAKRRPVRNVMVTELILALRKALKTQEKRQRRVRNRGKINIREDDITERIAILYKRIEELLQRIKNGEVTFSKLVEKWKRENIINTFLPLIYLDHDKKINCRQEGMFDEIFIKKR